MGEGILEYIVVGIIITVIVNIVVNKVRNLIILARNRATMTNVQSVDERVYHLPQNPSPTRPPIPPPLPVPRDGRTQTITRNQTTGNGSPPALPRPVGGRRREPDTFPMCPVCRCRNRVGMQQVVFWEQQTQRWRCHRGHVFSS